MTSFKAPIENSPDVMLAATSQGEVLYASPSSSTVFGYLREELGGRTVFKLIHLEDRDPFGRAFEDVVAQSRCERKFSQTHRIVAEARCSAGLPGEFEVLEISGKSSIRFCFAELGLR